jgi:hypothetical protein
MRQQECGILLRHIQTATKEKLTRPIQPVKILLKNIIYGESQ